MAPSENEFDTPGLMHRNKHREAAKMRRQRNMAQIKERITTPGKELNNMEISNLSDAELKGT